MFNKSIDDRLTEWINLRNLLDNTESPLQEVWDFWHRAPFIPHNIDIDPYYQGKWPSPWEIIEKNRYDDFTKSLMIAWTLKLTNKFKESKIELKTMTDADNQKLYNLIYIDENWVINYSDNGPVEVDDIRNDLRLENLINIASPR